MGSGRLCWPMSWVLRLLLRLSDLLWPHSPPPPMVVGNGGRGDCWSREGWTELLSMLHEARRDRFLWLLLFWVNTINHLFEIYWTPKANAVILKMEENGCIIAIFIPATAPWCANGFSHRIADSQNNTMFCKTIEFQLSACQSQSQGQAKVKGSNAHF